MNELVDTTEMYLRTIYDLEEEGVTPLRARIAERLEQSGPTVSQTVWSGMDYCTWQATATWSSPTRAGRWPSP